MHAVQLTQTQLNSDALHAFIIALLPSHPTRMRIPYQFVTFISRSRRIKLTMSPFVVPFVVGVGLALVPVVRAVG